jgi:hypothetical protein
VGLIKVLVVCHSIIRHVIDQEFMDRIEEELDRHIIEATHDDREHLKTDIEIKQKKLL